MEKTDVINEVIKEDTETTTFNNEKKPEEQVQIKKKRVIIGLPGDSFSSKFLLAWSNALANIWMSNKYDIIIAPGTGSFVSFVRMQTLGLDVRRGPEQKPFNGDNYDVWVTIDSDVVFSVDNLMKLIDSTDKYPVISGIYRMADLEHFAIVKDWDNDYFKQNGVFKFLKQDDLDEWKKDKNTNIMQIDYTGMGFFACRKEVLDKMKYPYFDGEVREILDGDNKIIMRDLSSEDVNFCKNIKLAGYDINVDVDLRVGHLKPILI